MTTERIYRAAHERTDATRFGMGRKHASAQPGAGERHTFRVDVKRVAREWPYGRIYLDGVEMTPNHARRVVALLEEAIARAEEKRL